VIFSVLSYDILKKEEAKKSRHRLTAGSFLAMDRNCYSCVLGAINSSATEMTSSSLSTGILAI